MWNVHIYYPSGWIESRLNIPTDEMNIVVASAQGFRIEVEFHDGFIE